MGLTPYMRNTDANIQGKDKELVILNNHYKPLRFVILNFVRNGA